MTAQVTLVTNNIHIANHGGWELQVNVGADQGDKITINVTCDHDINGTCFVGNPTANGIPLKLVKTEFRHQVFECLSPTTGDQIINAQYWWVGGDVHYNIHILASEAL